MTSERQQDDKYGFQCECCGNKFFAVSMNDAVLGIEHEKKCDANLGVPWHPKVIYDSRFPNKQDG